MKKEERTSEREKQVRVRERETEVEGDHDREVQIRRESERVDLIGDENHVMTARDEIIAFYSISKAAN